jgi:hypothetical protein
VATATQKRQALLRECSEQELQLELDRRSHQAKLDLLNNAIAGWLLVDRCLRSPGMWDLAVSLAADAGLDVHSPTDLNQVLVAMEKLIQDLQTSYDRAIATIAETQEKA